MTHSDPPIETTVDLQQLNKMARVNRQVINRLKKRVADLEYLLDVLCGDPQLQWLYRNRAERMDPTVPVFDSGRADFHLARYRFAADQINSRGLTQVADIACGTGYGSEHIKASSCAERVIGVDNSAEEIEYARRKHQPDGVEFIVAPAEATGLPDESLDAVVSFETIEHVEPEQATLIEWARLLRPGGILICSTPNQWPLEIAPHHVRVYDLRSFTDALSPHFEISEMFNQNSGSEFPYNHDQPAGIVETTQDNVELAECLLAIARKRS